MCIRDFRKNRLLLTHANEAVFQLLSLDELSDW